MPDIHVGRSDALAACAAAVDDLTATRQLVAALDACGEAELIVFSGGSSVGERDLVVDAIAARGEMIFHGIAVRPGKPTAFAIVSGTPFFGMPGNPTSCLSNAYVLLGTVGRDPSGAPLNSAAFISPSGAAGRYSKINLVPFGEFVPPLFSWVNKITKEAGDYAPGSQRSIFPIGSHTLSTFICYESAFPDFVRLFVRDGAQLLVNISNDGYFGNSAAREPVTPASAARYAASACAIVWFDFSALVSRSSSTASL